MSVKLILIFIIFKSSQNLVKSDFFTFYTDALNFEDYVDLNNAEVQEISNRFYWIDKFGLLKVDEDIEDYSFKFHGDVNKQLSKFCSLKISSTISR